jgi:Adenylate and Guanylate cyclase catalytic domain
MTTYFLISRQSNGLQRAASLMAAVVGRYRFTYDVWNDTVNTASRMESSGVPGRVQVTEETYRRLFPTYKFECPGPLLTPMRKLTAHPWGSTQSAA